MSNAHSQVIDEKEEGEEHMHFKIQDDCGSNVLDDVCSNDIIDTSTFNTDDEETWLMPSSNSRKLDYDLNIWLHTGLCKNIKESIENVYETNCPCTSSINTRTFTRSKKKLGKLHFDDIDKINDSNSKIEINWKEEAMRSRDCIPAMLKQSSSSGIVACGQESLEAFLNMSHSKGIDSFMNMVEPDLTDSFMNLSRSYLFHTNTSNTVVENAALGLMADSQILTDSMMQTSIFNDTVDTIGQNYNSTLLDESHNLLKNKSLSRTISLIKEITPSSSSSLLSSSSCDLQYSSDEPVIKMKDVDNFNIMDKTFDKSPVENSLEIQGIAGGVDDNYLVKNCDEIEPKILNATFDTDRRCSVSKILLNSTFKTSDIDEYRRNKNIIENQQMASNSTYISDNKIDDPLIEHNNKEIVINTSVTLNSDKSQSLDVTYLKKNDTETLLLLHENADSNVKLLKEQSDINDCRKNGLPINRYQTYKKIGKNNKLNQISEMPRNKILSDYGKNHQVKSMENLHKDNHNIKDTREVYSKLSGAKSLSRLPPVRQKSNPNLPSQLPTVMKNKKIPKQCASSSDIERVTLKNTVLTLTKKKYDLKEHKESDKIEMTKSHESIEEDSHSSISAYRDKFDIYADNNHHVASKLNLYSDKIRETGERREEELNQQSTPNCGRKILENTWVTNEKDLPSPILKNDNINGKQANPTGCAESGVQTSSPLISPAESLQSLPTITTTSNARRKYETHKFKCPLAVAEQQKNSTNKTEIARLPATTTSRSANLTSGIPRPTSRIPAPKFFKINAQMKNHNNSNKKSLF